MIDAITGIPVTPEFTFGQSLVFKDNAYSSIAYEWNSPDATYTLGRLINIQSTSAFTKTEALVFLPDATQGDKFVNVLFVNRSSTVTVKVCKYQDIPLADPVVICEVAPSNAIFLNLIDVSTSPGEWESMIVGPVNLSFSLPDIAGPGLTFNTTTKKLDVNEVATVPAASTLTINPTTDSAQTFLITPTSTNVTQISFDLTNYSQLSDQFWIYLQNYGTSSIPIQYTNLPTNSTPPLWNGDTFSGITVPSNAGWLIVINNKNFYTISSTLIKKTDNDTTSQFVQSLPAADSSGVVQIPTNANGITYLCNNNTYTKIILPPISSCYDGFNVSFYNVSAATGTTGIFGVLGNSTQTIETPKNLVQIFPSDSESDTIFPCSSTINVLSVILGTNETVKFIASLAEGANSGTWYALRASSKNVFFPLPANITINDYGSNYFFISTSSNRSTININETNIPNGWTLTIGNYGSGTIDLVGGSIPLSVVPGNVDIFTWINGIMINT